MDKVFEKVLFSYLDSQDFIQIKKYYIIHFAYSENDEYAQIRYDEDDGRCYINNDLIGEISSFFYLGLSGSEEVIGKWVENTIQMKVTNTIAPFKKVHLIVENT